MEVKGHRSHSYQKKTTKVIKERRDEDPEEDPGKKWVEVPERSAATRRLHFDEMGRGPA